MSILVRTWRMIRKEKKNEFHLPEYYENRELSWLKFDARVLNEAKDKSIPFS